MLQGWEEEEVRWSHLAKLQHQQLLESYVNDHVELEKNAETAALVAKHRR